MADANDLRLACVEHLFKSSLSVISGWATTLDDRWGELTDDQRRQAIAVIRKRSDHLALYIDRLVHAHAVELDVVSAELAPIDLRTVLDDVATWAVVPTDNRPLTVVADDEVVARADPDFVWQTLTLLVENAIKYSPADAAIELGARREGTRVEAWVRDEGIGLPEGCDVFAARERGGREAGVVPGVGLGLYICDSLVTAMGGTIEARSNDGVGATFLVSLPAG